MYAESVTALAQNLLSFDLGFEAWNIGIVLENFNIGCWLVRYTSNE